MAKTKIEAVSTTLQKRAKVSTKCIFSYDVPAIERKKGTHFNCAWSGLAKLKDGTNEDVTLQRCLSTAGAIDWSRQRNTLSRRWARYGEKHSTAQDDDYDKQKKRDLKKTHSVVENYHECLLNIKQKMRKGHNYRQSLKQLAESITKNIKE